MFDAKNPADYAAEVGVRLQALRLQRNITQAELARRAGISRPTLSALENGGKGSLVTLAHVMFVLAREQELDQLLQPDPPSTLEETTSKKTRKRASG